MHHNSHSVFWLTFNTFKIRHSYKIILIPWYCSSFHFSQILYRRDRFFSVMTLIHPCLLVPVGLERLQMDLAIWHLAKEAISKCNVKRDLKNVVPWSLPSLAALWHLETNHVKELRLPWWRHVARSTLLPNPGSVPTKRQYQLPDIWVWLP